MPSDAKLYLNHLEALFGVQSSSYSRVDSSRPDLPPIHAAFFHDVPEPGYVTAATFGLSLATHPDWQQGKPELLICVNTLDETWGEAVMMVVEAFRGECPFLYGDVLSYGKPISRESALSAFLVSLPALPTGPLTHKQAAIPVARETIFLKGIYPIYEGEIALLQEIGLERFWHLDGFNPWNIHRPDLSAALSAPPHP